MYNFKQLFNPFLKEINEAYQLEANLKLGRITHAVLKNSLSLILSKSLNSISIHL